MKPSNREHWTPDIYAVFTNTKTATPLSILIHY